MFCFYSYLFYGFKEDCTRSILCFSLLTRKCTGKHKYTATYEDYFPTLKTSIGFSSIKYAIKKNLKLV